MIEEARTAEHCDRRHHEEIRPSRNQPGTDTAGGVLQSAAVRADPDGRLARRSGRRRRHRPRSAFADPGAVSAARGLPGEEERQVREAARGGSAADDPARGRRVAQQLLRVPARPRRAGLHVRQQVRSGALAGRTDGTVRQAADTRPRRHLRDSARGARLPLPLCRALGDERAVERLPARQAAGEGSAEELGQIRALFHGQPSGADARASPRETGVTTPGPTSRRYASTRR